MKFVPRRLRNVLDTDVVVAALRSGTGASAEIVRLAGIGALDWKVSLPLFYEYADVCGREDHRRVARRRGIDVAEFLQDVAALVQRVRVDVKWRRILGDPEDEKVLEAALNAAAAIVTFNVRDYANASRQFDLLVETPGDLLRRNRDA